jgi:hypothetical protein
MPSPKDTLSWRTEAGKLAVIPAEDSIIFDAAFDLKRVSWSGQWARSLLERTRAEAVIGLPTDSCAS